MARADQHQSHRFDVEMLEVVSPPAGAKATARSRSTSQAAGKGPVATRHRPPGPAAVCTSTASCSTAGVGGRGRVGGYRPTGPSGGPPPLPPRLSSTPALPKSRSGSCWVRQRGQAATT